MTGEQITAGSVVLSLGDLSTLRIETTDLDEIDVARVVEGRTAQLTFDALPDVRLQAGSRASHSKLAQAVEEPHTKRFLPLMRPIQGCAGVWPLLLIFKRNRRNERGDRVHSR